MQLELDNLVLYLKSRFTNLGNKLSDMEKYQKELIDQCLDLKMDQAPTIGYLEYCSLSKSINSIKEEIMFINALICEFDSLKERTGAHTVEMDPILLTKIGYMETIFDRAKIIKEIDNVGRRNEEDYRKSLRESS